MKNFRLGLFFITFFTNLLSAQVTPVKIDDKYSLTFANLYFEVDALHGAKVSSFKIDNSEYLIFPSEKIYGLDVFWGGTTWVGPESLNTWPPYTVLDNESYTASINDSVITFVSAVAEDKEANKFQLIKSFWASMQDSTINIQYSLVNKSDVNIRKSIWEITRVAAEGLTFWAKGDNSPWGWTEGDNKDKNMSDKVVEEGDYYWMEFSNELLGEKKFFCDAGEGWLAHVNNSHQMFIKTFKNTPGSNYTTEDDEIEYWLAKDHIFIELENQSEYVELAPDDTLTYELKWYLRNISTNISLSVGNEELINRVKRIIDPNYSNVSLTSEIFYQPQIEVYPNPASGYISFDAQGINVFTVSVYTTQGQLIHTTLSSSGETLDISSFEEGLYIYKITAEGIAHSGKFLVR